MADSPSSVAAAPRRFEGVVCLSEPERLTEAAVAEIQGSPETAGILVAAPVRPALLAAASASDFLPGRRRDTGTTWHVLHTLSRQEKALAGTLEGMGIACFLPLRPQVRRRGGSRVVSHVPLFPGYVFLWGSLDEAYAADRTRRVANLIRVPDPAQLEWELCNLDRALVVQAPLDPYDALKVGLRARVVAGPCAGVEGLIASRARLDRLVLQVKMLGTAVSLDVDPALVELVGE
jgi:transcriptional antiterminator RfaH